MHALPSWDIHPCQRQHLMHPLCFLLWEPNKLRPLELIITITYAACGMYEYAGCGTHQYKNMRGGMRPCWLLCLREFLIRGPCWLRNHPLPVCKIHGLANHPKGLSVVLVKNGE